MDVEKALVDYIVHTDFDGIPKGPQDTIRNMVLTVLGTTIAGSRAEGCEPLVRFYKEMGGHQEATILIHGGKIPAQNAVLVNSVMARALDFDDAMAQESISVPRRCRQLLQPRSWQGDAVERTF